MTTNPRVWIGILLLAVCLFNCSGKQEGQDASGQSTPDLTVHLTISPTPMPPIPSVSRPLPGKSIADDEIDAHIPRSVDPADRKIIKEVMQMLPPRLRQYVLWLRVPPRKGPDYDSLPNHGLVVTFEGENGGSPGQETNAWQLPGLCILYSDGKVQPDAHVIYGYGLDSYVVPVPEGCSPLKYDE